MLHGKIFLVIVFFMWVRWSWPRFRFDQLMNLAWKIMLPLGLVNFLAIAILEEIRHVYAPESSSFAWTLGIIAAGWVLFAAAWLVDVAGQSAGDRQSPPPRLLAMQSPLIVSCQRIALSCAMKPDDPNIKWIPEPELGLAGKMYLPLIAQGLTTTWKHLTKSLRGDVVTVSYPDEEPKIGNPLIYRGVHRLNKDEQGRVKCVACFLCATACPAHCIDIIGVRKPLAGSRKVSAELQHRRAALHLLRHVRRGLPRRCHRADQPLQPDRPQPRGNDLRQGEAALSLRRDQGQGADAVAGPGRDRDMSEWLSVPLLLAADLPTVKEICSCNSFWAILVGSLAVWVLLPNRIPYGKSIGGVLAIVAAGLFASDWPFLGDWTDQAVFWLLSAVTLGAAVCTICSRSPVYSAIWFALSLLGTAGLFFYNGAQFLGVATIVVYAGAIVVTFLFVIMLSQPEGHSAYDRITWGWFPKTFSVLAAATMVALLTFLLGNLRARLPSR